MRLQSSVVAQGNSDQLLAGAPPTYALPISEQQQQQQLRRPRSRLPTQRARRAPRAAVGLPLDDFRARFALLSLHLWLVLVRLRAEGETGQEVGQALYDHFWADMEQRVRDEGVVVRLSKWMKELETAFYGSCVARAAPRLPPPPRAHARW